MRIKAFMIDSAKAIVGFAHRFRCCFVSGPDFSRAAISRLSAALAAEVRLLLPFPNNRTRAAIKKRTSGAKALIHSVFSARLKSCPDTKHQHRDLRRLRSCLNSGSAFSILLVYLGGLCRSDEETLPTFSNSQGAWTEELRAHRGGVLTFARHLSKHGGTYESQ
jgi:methylphosphotriester-DNA--protein-cysteine methyltransferase